VGGNSRRAARRATELGEGWIPFEVTLEEVGDRLKYIRALPAYEQRRTPLEVVIPAGAVELASEPIDGDRPRFSGSREQVLDDIKAYQELGVTGMTVGFRSRSLDEHLEKMEQFAHEIMPAFE
jgi:alkanesulfonate monooxygenase SsuD/methylene tetrahydromethanopterin reductase-like flavin-dependent oxidoreductase (luciferase family)